MSEPSEVTIDDIDWTSIEDEETLVAEIDGMHVEAIYFGAFWRVSTRKQVFGDNFSSELRSEARFASKSEISLSARKCLAAINKAETALEAAGLIHQR